MEDDIGSQLRTVNIGVYNAWTVYHDVDWTRHVQITE